MKEILPLFLYFFLCSHPVAAIASPKHSENFKVFEATKYKNLPDMKPYGIKKIGILYDHQFWGKNDDRNNLPKDEKIINLAMQYTKYEYIVLDIEQWKTQGYYHRPWIAKNNINKYIHVFNLFKKYTTNSKVGYFAKVPVSNYKQSLAPPHTDLYEKWRRENAKMKPIADIIDVAYPSTYTYEQNWCTWEKSFLSKIEQMKTIYNGEFYPFLWPQFHEKSSDKSIRLKYIDYDFWLFQLITARKYADGLVIWGGWDFDKWNRKDWKDDMPWWNATKYFMQNINDESLLSKKCTDQVNIN